MTIGSPFKIETGHIPNTSPRALQLHQTTQKINGSIIICKKLKRMCERISSYSILKRNIKYKPRGRRHSKET
jgi:hypothetical protein